MSYDYYGYNSAGQQPQRDVRPYGQAHYGQPQSTYYSSNDALMPNMNTDSDMLSDVSRMNHLNTGSAVHSQGNNQAASAVTSQEAEPGPKTVFRDNIEILQTLQDHQEILWTASGKPKSGKGGSPGRMQQMNEDGINAIVKSRDGAYPQKLKDAVIALNANPELKKRLMGEDGIANIGHNGIRGAAFKRGDLGDLLQERNHGIVNALGNPPS